jgi:penicillin-binding protein 1A
MKVVGRILVVVAAALIIAVGGLTAWFYSGLGLPKLSSLKEYKAAQNSKVFSSEGRLLVELHGDQNREIIALAKIPDPMRQAVISIEDSDYYRHGGVDWKSVARALWANVVKGTVVQGGSTITQQYVKNAYVGQKRTLLRKIQEAYLAYQITKKYSKDKILEMYLNDIYFGQSCYGIYTAAEKYFGKAPQDLTLAECATLAGVIRSPSYYDPYQRPEAVTERRNLVLKKMEEQGYIDRAQEVAAIADPLTVQPPVKVYRPSPAPYFCDYITKLVRSTYGDQQAFRGGLRIYTTIDLRLQEMAEKTLLSELNPAKGPDAAIACVDPRTGYIKALVGGKNYFQSQFDVAAEGRRQAGSAFKVFVLSRAMADGISPEDSYDSSSPRIIRLPDGTKWVVNNYDGHGSGSMTIRNATIHSVNVVFAQLIMDVGSARVADLAKQMGIMSPVDTNPAIALGGLSIGVTPLDMASAYGTLADNGVHAIPRSIYKITDAAGNLIVENQPETHTILAPSVAAKVNEILQEVVSSGTGRGASIGRPQAGKTGTTEDHADAWFVGYTPDLVTAVWVGYPQGRISLGGMVGGDLPATIWREFMGQALDGVPPTAFNKEKGLEEQQQEGRPSGETVTVTVCADSGLLATPYCPHTVRREFTRGEEPTTFCNLHRGPTATTVPGVVGMTQSQAKTALAQAGYSVSVTTQASSQAVAGTVISQSPAAGTAYAGGNTVTIVVSTGAQSSMVPSVVGMSESAARTKISVCGFSAGVTYAQGGTPGVVISQSPGVGTKLPIGSTVSIVVAEAKGTGALGWLTSMIRAPGASLGK